MKECCSVMAGWWMRAHSNSEPPQYPVGSTRSTRPKRKAPETFLKGKAALGNNKNVGREYIYARVKFTFASQSIRSAVRRFSAPR